MQSDPYQPYQSYRAVDAAAKKPKPPIVPESDIYGLTFIPLMWMMVVWMKKRKR